jgi:hypothetical protein
MKTNVTFLCPEEFVRVSEDDGILSAKGADWFVTKLKKISAFAVDDRVYQEDWGVAIIGKRKEKRFWVGLSFFPDGEICWLVHVHHGPWTFLQRVLPSGKAELYELARDLDRVLKADATVSRVRWYRAEDLQKGHETWSEIP